MTRGTALALAFFVDAEDAAAADGFNVLMVDEQDGRTVATCLMQHASTDVDADDPFGSWRTTAAESRDKWRAHCIPTLREFVEDRS